MGEKGEMGCVGVKDLGDISVGDEGTCIWKRNGKDGVNLEIMK